MRISGINWASPLARGLGMALPLQRYLPIGMDVARGRDATAAGVGSAFTFEPLPALGGYAIRGDGTEQYLSLPPLLDWMDTAGTLSVWVQMDANDSQDGFWYLGNDNAHFTWSDGAVYDGSLSTVRKAFARSTYGIVPANLNLVTVTSTANDWRYYVNGRLTFSTGTNTFWASHSAYRLGAPLSSTSYPMAGRLAHFMAWDRVLSAREVAALYAPATRWDAYRFAPVMVPVHVEAPTGTTHETALSVAAQSGYAASAAQVFGGALTLSASGALALSTVMQTAQGVALGAVANVLQVGALNTTAALALAAQGAQAQAQDSAIETAATLAAAADQSAAATADFEAAATLAGVVAITPAAQQVTTLALALAAQSAQAQTSTTTADVEAALSFAASAAMSQQAAASFEAAATLSAAAQILQSAGGSAYSAAALVAAIADLAQTLQADLQASGALTASAQIAQLSGLAQDVAATLSATAAVTFTGVVLDVTIVTPAGRTLFIQADDRTLIIKADDRTLTIAADDRTLTIKG